MKLEDLLKITGENKYIQYIRRKQWRRSGNNMKLLTSVKTIKELNVLLMKESYEADDWEICEE